MTLLRWRGRGWHGDESRDQCQQCDTRCYEESSATGIAFLATGAEGRSIRKIRRTNAGRRHLGIDLGSSRQRLGRGHWHVALEARIDCAKPNPIARMQGDFTGPDSVNSCPVSRTKTAELVRLVGPTQFRMPARNRRIINVNGVVRSTTDRDDLFDEVIAYSANDQL